MNRPKPSSFSSPLAMTPMGFTSSVVRENVADSSTNNGRPQPSMPRVDSTGTTSTAASTNADGESKNGSKPSDKTLLRVGNIRSLVFDAQDVRTDIKPPDENDSPDRVAAAGSKRKAVTGEIPILEVKKLHAFRKDQMPVYWNITNLKPNKVTRHLRCLLLALESRPAFDQIRPQYNQLRDHFVYSYGFLQIHSATTSYQAKLQALFKLVFDELHRLLALADRLESIDNDGDNEDEDEEEEEEEDAGDENDSEQPGSAKRPRLE